MDAIVGRISTVLGIWSRISVPLNSGLKFRFLQINDKGISIVLVPPWIPNSMKGTVGVIIVAPPSNVDMKISPDRF